MSNSFTSTPNGKIGRLPHTIRDQLNSRLRSHEQAKTILPWLNQLPGAKTLLAAEFDSRPINKQNLSEWKKHGFRDWLLRQQALEFVKTLETPADLSDQVPPDNFPEKLCQWASLQYAPTTRPPNRPF